METICKYILLWSCYVTRIQLKASLKSPNFILSLKSDLLQDLHLKLDQAQFVLLVVLDPAVVGAALHVHQLPGRLGVDLDRHQWRVVAHILVYLVPLALID